jgi:hypothetical protein
MTRLLRATIMLGGLVAGLAAALLFQAPPMVAVTMLLGGAAPILFKSS